MRIYYRRVHFIFFFRTSVREQIISIVIIIISKTILFLSTDNRNYGHKRNNRRVNNN